MKKYSLKNLMLLPVLLSLLIGCQEKPDEISGINNSLPEINSINSSAETVKSGQSIEVSVSVTQGDRFNWTASAGSFLDPTKNPATWSAPDEGGVFKLICEAINSSGSRKASISIPVIKITVPIDAVSYWPFEGDLDDYAGNNNSELASAVSLTFEDAAIGQGSLLLEGEDEDISSAIFPSGGTDLKMGPDDTFSISVWIKTTDDGNGWIFGRTHDALYDSTSKGLYVDEGTVRFHMQNVGRVRADVEALDGEWHHVAVVKEGITVTIYYDGEEAVSDDLEDWTEDNGTVLTIGSAWEEEGTDFPGTFQGNIDDLRFYQKTLTADEVKAIFDKE
jgi:hypothetical protein